MSIVHQIAAKKFGWITRDNEYVWVARGVGGNPKIVAKRDPSVSNSAWKAFFRWTWTAILLPENWVSWISPNMWQDTVSHRLMNEGDNLERSLYCACWGCYPRLSGGGSHLMCVTHEKIALAHEHNWASITSTSAHEVARTSARRLGHPARGGFFLDFCSLPPTPQWPTPFF